MKRNNNKFTSAERYDFVCKALEKKGYLKNGRIVHLTKDREKSMKDYKIAYEMVNFGEHLNNLPLKHYYDLWKQAIEMNGFEKNGKYIKPSKKMRNFVRLYEENNNIYKIGSSDYEWSDLDDIIDIDDSSIVLPKRIR